jgi:hypothetical protein
MPGSQFGKQSPANTVPPEICMDRQVQQLRLALHNSPHYGESDNALSASRHDEIVEQILADVPLGCFGGYRLHSSDAGQIARARRTTTGGNGSGFKPDLAGGSPHQGLGDRLGTASCGAIMRLDARACGDPAESGHTE